MMLCCPAEDKRRSGRQVERDAMLHGTVGQRGGLGEVDLPGHDAAMPAEVRSVAVQDQPVFAGIEVNGIVGERLLRIEANQEDETRPLEAQQLVRLMLQDQPYLLRIE